MSKVLGSGQGDEIDPDEDLLLLGLDSLRYAELTDAWYQEFGIDPFDVDVDLPSWTIRDLARRTESLLDSCRNSSSVIDENDGGALHASRFISPADFPPISLAIDDLVPNQMEIALAFSYDISGDVFEAIQAGINAFPHFTGVIEGTVESMDLAVTPGVNEVVVEQARRNELSPDDLWAFGNEQLRASFFPQDQPQIREGLVRSPLFAARSTSLSGGSVLALRISHVLVDGVGLAHFLRAALSNSDHGDSLPLWQHSRDLLRMSQSTDAELPGWYRFNEPRSSQATEWQLAEQYGASVFPFSRVGRRDAGRTGGPITPGTY